MCEARSGIMNLSRQKTNCSWEPLLTTFASSYYPGQALMVFYETFKTTNKHTIQNYPAREWLMRALAKEDVMFCTVFVKILTIYIP